MVRRQPEEDDRPEDRRGDLCVCRSLQDTPERGVGQRSRSRRDQRRASTQRRLHPSEQFLGWLGGCNQNLKAVDNSASSNENHVGRARGAQSAWFLFAATHSFVLLDADERG